MDKSAFQGWTADDLRRFTEKRVLLVPWVLLYEVLTEDVSNRVSPTTKLLKLKGTRFAVCKRLPDLFAEEEKKCVPARCVTRADWTSHLKAWLEEPSPDPPSHTVIARDLKPDLIVKNVVDYRRGRLRTLADSDLYARRADIDRLARERGWDRAKAWAVLMQKPAERLWEHHHLYPKLKTRNSFRFMEVWLSNYYDFRRSLDTGNQIERVSDKVLFNEALDRYYLLLLIQARGLLTEDDDMARIAEAFFPGKQVLRREDLSSIP